MPNLSKIYFKDTKKKESMLSQWAYFLFQDCIHLPAVSMVDTTHVACLNLADSSSKETIIELQHQWKLLFGLNCVVGTYIW